MANKILVYGKAQNRTVLGIINAYLKIHPKATLEELNNAFPQSLSSANRGNIIYSLENAKKFESGNQEWTMFFFAAPEDYIKLTDGTIGVVQNLWQKPDLMKVIEHVKQFYIEVSDSKPAEGFDKRGFRLEYINGYTPEIPKKKSLLWLWISLIILILGLIVYFMFGK